MKADQDKIRQLSAILNVLEQKKTVLAGQMNQLNQSIEHKNKLLVQFKQYVQEYEEKQQATLRQSMLFHNTQSFISRLMTLMETEMQALNQLNVKKTDLISHYQAISVKVDRVRDLLKQVNDERRKALEQAEEMASHDFYGSNLIAGTVNKQKLLCRSKRNLK